MDACPICNGTGLDPLTPRRVTRNEAPRRAVLALVKPCYACEGRGVVVPAVDRDLMLTGV